MTMGGVGVLKVGKCFDIIKIQDVRAETFVDNFLFESVHIAVAIFSEKLLPHFSSVIVKVKV